MKRNQETPHCRTIKYIDLCSGIGGFRVAINKLVSRGINIKFHCVLSADIKQDAIDTYNINFNENNTIVDVYSLQPAKIEPFDLLCAGFPCQPFSSAGQKKGFSDERGGMIFKIIDLCKHHRPEYVLLENVFNLLNIDKGKCIQKIQDLFAEVGYSVTYKKLNSCDFGCPQSRERVYIICSLLNKPIDMGKIKHKDNVYLREVLDSSCLTSNLDETFVSKLLKLHQDKNIYGCKIGDKRGGCNNIHSWDIGYNGEICHNERSLMKQIMLERRKKHWAKKKGITWMDGMPLTYEDIATFNKDENLHIMLNNLVDKNYLRLEKCKELVNGKRVFKEDSEEGYNICKGKLSFPISKILDPNDISPTLTATDSHKLGVIIDNKTIRHLTPTELKKICGFPDEFILPKHVNCYDLFGNMATPPVIEAILQLMYSFVY